MSHVITHVANPLTDAVTTFSAYAFNSFAELDGAYYAASPNGLYRIDAPASAEVFDGSMSTALLHFGVELQKRVSDVYMAARSEGDISITVTVDEVEIGTYVLKPEGVSTIRQRRVAVGKGAKGKYWQFKFECSEVFDYDTINIAAVAMSRRL